MKERHPNAECLRALADGKQVVVRFPNGYSAPIEDRSTTVCISLFRPCSVPQSEGWTFHIEDAEVAAK